ncbi:ATP-binding protein [Paraliobacillus salinarum]|uniref:ATP-binding protein n=1 Tax=Paraliobacillus salinarum TaxID=1158996 RepID=UPI0015F50BA2|nr:ATP-binding protein [Paraliobacillus salinarum]
MIMHSKKLGVIVGVEGDVSQVGMYHMSNEAEFIWYGDILTGPKIGAFLTINQNEVKIIATVSTEKIIDQQNSIKSAEFDNRYAKNSINRIITLKVKGVINEEIFEVTSQYVPMIGNEVTLTTQEELKIIYGVDNIEETILIGESILESQPIRLSINRFFASHIGIFGNTGSGKSNTLHKLYLELLSTKYRKSIIKKSQFYIMDFNGEYTGKNMFGIDEDSKKCFKVNTRNPTEGNKIPVTKEYLFDADILSVLFDAKPGTQVPFLREAMNTYNKCISNPHFHFGEFVTGLLKRILTTGGTVNQNSLQEWIQVSQNYYTDTSQYVVLEQLEYFSSTQSYRTKENNYINSGAMSNIEDETWRKINLHIISNGLNEVFQQLENNPTKQLKMFLDFQKVYKTAWGKVNSEHLNPLFNRINTSFDSLEKVVLVVENINDEFSAFNIISLVKANQEITRLIPMLLSKMIYDEQKNLLIDKAITHTKHLIIDEAHNILSDQKRNISDDWQDYRLSIFEEIIKEGRKFGFYLTLSSQRPADISPTILSQTHNYLIHRLVNENDLRMLENTMPTLDKNSFQMIPSLGKGEVIITGNAIQVPVFVKIPKEKSVRPNSDDVLLTELWID